MATPYRQQQTIAAITTVRGFGYWSGKDVCVEFHPTDPDSGVTFVRTDLSPHVRIPATCSHRVEAPRRTNLAQLGVSVEMVEHIMAALSGLQIDNCEVHVDAAEMPGLDGSSLGFVDALTQVDIVAQDALRSRLVIAEVTRVGDDECWIEARPSRSNKLSLKYRLDYGSENAIGRQTYELHLTPESFVKELAAARTFLLKEEADWLQQQGLGTRVTYGDLIVFGDEGPIDNELRYEDECVRHKTLDVVGDLALAGCDIVGDIVGYRCGHRQNFELVRALLAEHQIEEPVRRAA